VTLLVGLLLLLVVVVGFGLSYLTGVDLILEERLAYGAFFGMIAFTICSVLTTRIFSFSGLAVVAAIGLALMISAFGWRTGVRRIIAEVDDFKQRLKASLSNPGNHLVFSIFVALGWIWAWRILSLAYDETNGGVDFGNLATFSDWQAHATYTASFAISNNVGFDLPMATGETLNYHSGINFFAASLYQAGASLHAALTISSGFLAFFFPAAMYLVGVRVFNSRWIAGLGTAIFFFFGGLGWTHAITTSKTAGTVNDQGIRLNLADDGFGFLQTLPGRYTRFYEAGYWLENPVVGHLYPQRPTLIGFPVTLIASMLLWHAYQNRNRQTFLFAGVLVGVMPFFHLFGYGTPFVLGIIWAFSAQFEDREFDRSKHLLLFIGVAVVSAMVFGLVMAMGLGVIVATGAAVIVGGFAALAVQAEEGYSLPWRKEWLAFLMPAFMLSMPMVMFMRPETSSADFWYSWAVRITQTHETTSGIEGFRLGPENVNQVGAFTTITENVRFWFKNFGFFLPLLAVTQFLSIARNRIIPRRIAVATLPVWLWFIGPLFTKLHPWNGNNTHYLVFVLLLGALPVAALLVHLARSNRVLGWTLVPLLVFTMTASGALDLWGSGDADTPGEHGQLMSAADVVMSEWVIDNTPDDAVFVVQDSNTHPMSSLTGRRIVGGFQGWIFDLGVEDWFDRTENSGKILQGSEETPTLIQQYDVDYVVIGLRERNDATQPANIEYWDQNGQLVYDLGDYLIYRVNEVT